MKPEGRPYYESRAPARDEFLAKTLQGTKEDVDMAVSPSSHIFPRHHSTTWLHSKFTMPSIF